MPGVGTVSFSEDFDNVLNEIPIMWKQEMHPKYFAEF